MKWVYIGILTLSLFPPTTVAQTSAASPTEQEIRALEQERNRAILQGDAVALERMTADDYTFITLRGELRTKSEIVKGFESGSFKYESRQISDLKIRVYGDYRCCNRTLDPERQRGRQGLQW